MNSKSEFFIDDLLHEQETRFCTYSNATIHVTTFNVNGRSAPKYIGNWLEFDTTKLPDFIAIGFQEMDLALGTYVADNVIKQEEWLFVLGKALPNVYVKMECVRLVGIFLVMFRNKNSKFKISNISTSIVPTGFLKFGNKGGVGISLEIDDSMICIINSHLAAGSELARRNQDYRDISQIQFSNFKGVYDHDVVIWLGDLNYRLSAPLPFEEVVHLCVTGGHSSLFQFDQLREQQKLMTAFGEFREMDPPFKPTYKYDVGTHNWDSSEKRRTPAWCDRILYRMRDKNAKIEQISYTSSDSVTFSDHKPVNSLFKLSVKKVNKDKRSSIYDELLREADRKSNDLLPNLELSAVEVHFGEIHFEDAIIATMTIKNTGLTSTRFNFSNQHQMDTNSNFQETWVTVTPKSSFIEIGAEMLITLQACVKSEAALKLKSPTQLLAALILSLDGGRDYFIMVDAIFMPGSLSNGTETNKVENSEDPDEKWLINFDDTGPSAK